MSRTADHESRQTQRQCETCRERKARFRHEGTVRADRSHTLCFACFRAERDRLRARRLAEVPIPAQMRSPFGPQLTSRQLSHRGAMLAHLLRAR